MHLIVATVMTAAAFCGEPQCENVVTEFVFINDSPTSAHMFSGYESEQAQISNSSCVDTSLFLLPGESQRTYTQPEDICSTNRSLRNIGVSAGPPGSSCGSALKSIPSSDELFKQNLRATARWDGTTVTLDVEAITMPEEVNDPTGDGD